MVSPQEFGEGRCAKFVRLALADAGLVPASHPVSAKDWGPTLVSLGFAELAAGDTAYQLGDVAVIQGTSESKDGHIQGYDSAACQWISDFVQKIPVEGANPSGSALTRVARVAPAGSVHATPPHV